MYLNDQNGRDIYPWQTPRGPFACDFSTAPGKYPPGEIGRAGRNFLVARPTTGRLAPMSPSAPVEISPAWDAHIRQLIPLLKTAIPSEPRHGGRVSIDLVGPRAAEAAAGHGDVRLLFSILNQAHEAHYSEGLASDDDGVFDPALATALVDAQASLLASAGFGRRLRSGLSFTAATPLPRLPSLSVGMRLIWQGPRGDSWAGRFLLLDPAGR